MRKIVVRLAAALTAAWMVSGDTSAAEEPSFQRTEVVVHGSQPKCAISETLDRRLVRYAPATGFDDSDLTGAGQR